MAAYLLRRLLLTIPTLLLAFTAVFVLLRLIPGDAVTLLFDNSQYSRESYEEFRRQLGISEPLPVQYGKFLRQAVTGDLGRSIWSGRPVVDELVRERLPLTLELSLAAATFGVVIGVSAGILAALRQDSSLDLAVRSIAVAGLAVPGFWLATLVLVLPSIWWGWTLPLGYKSLRQDPSTHLQQIVVPALIMSVGLAAALMRMTRAMMLEVLRQDYVRTARAKGLHGTPVVLRHCLRNAMIPLVSVLGVQLAVLISGTVIFESIFSLPGVGSYLFQGVSRRDYPVVQGVAIFLTTGVVLINLLVDLTYPLLDPRVHV